MNAKMSMTYLLLACSIIAASFFPLLVNSYPPLVDYPIHLSRLYLISGLKTDAFIQEHYQYHFHMLPYLGLEIITLPLMYWVPLKPALDIYLALTFCLLFSGTIALHRILFDKWSFWPLLSGYFLFNEIFFWGFLPYLMGVGLLLWAITGWIYLKESRMAIRVFYGIFAGLALYLFHLAIFVFFALAIFIYESGKTFTSLNKRSIGKLAVLVGFMVIIPITLFFNTGIRDYLLDQDFVINYKYNWLNKLKYLGLTFSSNYFVLDAIVLICLMLSILYILKRSRFEYARSLIAVPIALFALFLILPTVINSASFIDTRIPIAIVFLFIACTNVQIDLETSQAKWICAFVCSLIVARSLFIGYEWKQFDSTVEPIMSELSQLPKSSTLFTAIAEEPGLSPIEFRALRHVADYAAVVNTIYVPDIHAQRNQKNLTLRDRYADFYAFRENHIKTQDDFNRLVTKMRNLQHKTNPDRNAYLLLIQYGQLPFTWDEPTTLVSQGKYYSFFRLYESPSKEQ